MFAIAFNALYTSLRRRGTTRQLAGAIMACVVSALLLLAALEWYNQRFIVEDTAVSVTEVGIVLVYVVLWGWLLPLSTTIAYCLLCRGVINHAPTRTSHDSIRLPSLRLSMGQAVTKVGVSPDPTMNRSMLPREQASSLGARSSEAVGNSASGVFSPLSSYAPVTPIPFTFSEDNPWGWLEHCNGRFRGQQLKLAQMIVKLGRGEDVDILLEDEPVGAGLDPARLQDGPHSPPDRVQQGSPLQCYHAELVWSPPRSASEEGIVSIINREGPVLLNGRPIIGPTMLKQGDVFEVGSQLFRFVFAQRSQTLAEPGDPLEHQTFLRRGQQTRQAQTKRSAPITPAPVDHDPADFTKPLQDDEDNVNSVPHLMSGPVPLRLPSKQILHASGHKGSLLASHPSLPLREDKGAAQAPLKNE